MYKKKPSKPISGKSTVFQVNFGLGGSININVNIAGITLRLYTLSKSN